MDFIPKDKYLKINANTLEEVRRDVNLHRPGEMKEAVRILHEWIQQQAHFKKKDFPLHYLEMTIVSSKGSLERAKKVFDAMCTARTLKPNLFEPYAPNISIMQIWETNYFIILPKLTLDNARMFLLKYNGKYNRINSLDNLYRYAYMIFDYLLMHDYFSKVVVIYDLTEMDLLDTFKNLNLLELKNCFQILLECYSTRLQRFHLVSDSKIVDKFISFFRPFIKAKLMDRVTVNKTVEDLFEYYPKEILPKEYGGEEKCLSELYDGTIEILSSEEHLDHVKSMMDAQVDESQRSRAQFNELYTGTLGTFRTLAVD